MLQYDNLCKFLLSLIDYHAKFLKGGKWDTVDKNTLTKQDDQMIKSHSFTSS